MDDRIRQMFTNGATYDEIAERLGVTRNVIAGRCRKMGLRRHKVPTEVIAKRRRDAALKREQRKREEDQRDIDILCDIDEGHDPEDVAVHWNVPFRHVWSLMETARD